MLGEEVSESGTARYVDSSVERLQVSRRGPHRGRHVVTCNGVPVPLQTTSSPGTGVAGVRYRRGRPVGAAPDDRCPRPLVFDVVDRWSSKSVGGCTYHVSHPGGRYYDTFPVNANEAEARRCSRFFKHGHTPGVVDIAELDRIAATLPFEYSRTLDLRHHAPA